MHSSRMPELDFLMTDDSTQSPIDQTLVKSLLGKTVLVGMTYYSEQGNTLEQRQFFGAISDISENGVVLTHQSSGETLTLPPDFSNYKKAEKGEYTLRGSGEVVVNPDLITTWKITRPTDETE